MLGEPSSAPPPFIVARVPAKKCVDAQPPLRPLCSSAGISSLFIAACLFMCLGRKMHYVGLELYSLSPPAHQTLFIPPGYLCVCVCLRTYLLLAVCFCRSAWHTHTCLRYAVPFWHKRQKSFCSSSCVC